MLGRVARVAAARADHANLTSSSVAAASTLLRRAGVPVVLSGTRARERLRL